MSGGNPPDIIVTAPRVGSDITVTTPEPVPNAPNSTTSNVGSGAGTTNPTGTGQVYFGAAGPGTASNDFTTLYFIAQQIVAQISTATIVQVVGVYPASGSGILTPGTIGPTGRVDVLPMVEMLDGTNDAYPHSTIYGLLYFRLGAGPNAIIIDPEIGDIGLAVFADRDISIVKNTGNQSRPGSRRRFDMADGVYFGGLLNATPSNYVTFTKDSQGNRGITIQDANANKVILAKAGIIIEDDYRNTIALNQYGIGITDLNGNAITMNSSGVTINAAANQMVEVNAATVKIIGSTRIDLNP